MKPTIVVIHGGETFTTDQDFYAYLRNRTCKPFEERKKRRDWLKQELETQLHTVIMPEMPAKQNADYTARSIRFEKHIPFFGEHGVIFVGYSLGGVFLAKWLSEHKLSHTIHQLHLVAAPFDNNGLESGEDLCGFQVEGTMLKKIQAKQVHFYQSSDDPYIPWSHLEAYKAWLPDATVHKFSNKNHFFQSEFPELLNCIYQRDN